ncbi:alpha/beta hydrolase [Pseudomonas sp. YuFO20]|jgi:acetyl esterase/lipase|uniref:Alpha/beta hydrolase n=1 Tax=Pseudomonas neuropathica TaxID=2730425 RepID=A0ACC7N240_9PSED|nr:MULTISPECIES: alpha/beta hydrolase [unclassified Pseudomonas]MEB2518581.1 alpha/beta hydrolase [Pseudomonas sp. YuFO20]MEB2626049.1 alpha/beta hydrolase [Pseudomonas sp. YuFO8]
MNILQKTLAISLLALSIDNAIAAGSPGVEHNTQAFLEALAAGGGKPLEQMSPKDARAVLTGAQASVKVDLSGVEVSDRSISVGEQIIKLKIVRPAKVKGELPVFMFFHGGGWVLGDFPTHQRLIRDLVVGSGAVAVYVDYTPSPEAQFPTAINQAYGATRWVAEHGKDIGVDGKRLAVAGNSVGGNMAAVVALMAKEQKAPALRFQLLMWPVTNAGFDSGSYQQFAEGHFLTKGMMQWFWDNYTTNPAERAQIHASPLNASAEQLKGLPAALVQTAEFDVLRDEGEGYARHLDAAGVPVTSVRYNGMIHDFGLLNPLSSIPEVKAAVRQAALELKTHLN